MADIEEAIYSRITATTTAIGTRCYPSAIFESSTVLPAVVFERVGGSHQKTMAGMAGVAEAEFDILCIGSAIPGTSGYKDIKSLRNTIRLAIDGKTGTWGGVDVRACHIDDEIDEPEYAVGVDQQRRQAVGLRTRFWYRESTT